MAKQFVYQDAHGILYPAHAALAFQPGLVPGWYDTDTRTFTPTGNPQEQVGHIVTDAGVGTGAEKVLSGLREDRGADTAPLTGVVVTTPEGEPDTAARLVEVEAELAAERERGAALQAQLARWPDTPTGPFAASTLNDTSPAQTPRPDPPPLAVENPQAVTVSHAAPSDAPAASSRRARKVTR